MKYLLTVDAQWPRVITLAWEIGAGHSANPSGSSQSAKGTKYCTLSCVEWRLGESTDSVSIQRASLQHEYSTHENVGQANIGSVNR